MTGRRLLRIILGLVAANVVGVTVCFAFVLLFKFPDQVGLSSRAQQWFYGFVVMAIWPSDVTSHVHLRVMEHIKTLAEGDR